MTATGSSGRSQQLAITAVVAATIVVLHLLGRGTLAAPPLDSVAAITSWAEHQDPVTIGFSVLRLVALAIAYHLVATTALMVTGRILQRPGLVRVAEATTLPPLRGTVRRLVGLGLSAGLVLTQPLPSAHARPQATTALVTSGIPADPHGRTVVERIDLPPSQHSTAVLERIDLKPTSRNRAVLERIHTSAEHGRRAAVVRVELPPAAPLAPTKPPVPHPLVHHVAPGDHLWSIAADQLALSLQRAPTDAEVAPHWKAVVALNPQLADPDVLFPGDEISLPPAPMG